MLLPFSSIFLGSLQILVFISIMIKKNLGIILIWHSESSITSLASVITKLFSFFNIHC